MKKQLTLLTLLSFLFLWDNATACEQWIQRANFGGVARHRCTAFSIGNRGYIGGGHINSATSVYHADYWEYDPGSDTWTQIADFGGGKRYHSVAFTVGNFGYVGCGEDENDTYHSDFYRYVPTYNVWQPVASLPGFPRRGATSFVIGNYGYVGTGQTDLGYENDFYKYDPLVDTWYPIADFIGEARSSAVGFAHNGKGYVGTGHVMGDDTKDFYEYNPVGNSWIQKSDVGITDRQDATGFVLNGKAYICTGNDVAGNENYKDVWEYNFATDSWVQIEDFCGEGRRYMVSFVIGDVAYAGTGTDGTNFRDFYMFNPLLSNPENQLELAIAPYPNPSSDAMKFDFKNKTVDLSIFASSGQLVYRVEQAENALIVHSDFIGKGKFIYHISTNEGLESSGLLIFE